MGAAQGRCHRSGSVLRLVDGLRYLVDIIAVIASFYRNKLHIMKEMYNFATPSIPAHQVVEDIKLRVYNH